MPASLGAVDIAILALYGCVLVGMGIYYVRKSRTAEEFMVGNSLLAFLDGKLYLHFLNGRLELTTR